MKTIRKVVSLHPKQYEFVHSPKLYRAFVGGRGAGKTHVGAYDLIRRAVRGGVYMVIGPTYANMRDSSMRTFLALAREFGVLDPSQTRLSSPPQLTLSTGAEILFRSGDDPERLRGPSLAGAWLDEASLMARDVFDIVIAALRDRGRQGWLSATFTPKGPLSWVYEAFHDNPDASLTTAPTAANPFLPPDFVETLKRQYGDSPFAEQELGGKFVSLEGATFPAHWLPESILVSAWPDGITRQVLYTDPSQGKDSKSGDAQAHCRAGFWPGAAKQNLIYLLCHAHREDPPAMVSRGVRLCREQRVDLWAYETNGTLGLLEAEVNRQVKESSLLIRTWPHNNTDPKAFRIRGALMPYLARGQIRIVDTPGGRQLRNELLVHPSKDAHDDCADAAAGAVSYLEQLVGGG